MEKEKIEIIKDFFVGDYVILEKETKLSNESGFKIGVVAVVSESDTLESLEGWKVIDLKNRFKEALDKMSPEKINSLMEDISKIHLPEEKNIKQIQIPQVDISNPLASKAKQTEKYEN